MSCVTEVPIRLQEKFYQTVVRLALLYGMKMVLVKKREENDLNVAEM